MSCRPYYRAVYFRPGVKTDPAEYMRQVDYGNARVDEYELTMKFHVTVNDGNYSLKVEVNDQLAIDYKGRTGDIRHSHNRMTNSFGLTGGGGNPSRIRSLILTTEEGCTTEVVPQQEVQTVLDELRRQRQVREARRKARDGE